ncbi:MAG: VOC family protein [Acidimicrobiia bacterium]
MRTSSSQPALWPGEEELNGENGRDWNGTEDSVTQHWPIIAVADVPRSSGWYAELLQGNENHPDASVFNQILADDGAVLLCLHKWGPSGPRGDHHWPSLADPGSGRVGNGILLWFVVDDFPDAWERAQKLGSRVEESPNTNNGTGMRAFVVTDPDGYSVAINEIR